MNAVIWVLRGFLFFILLGLAIKNSGEVELRFFFDAYWQASLSLVILVSLATGAVLGLLALLPQLVRQRRSISHLQQRQLERRAGKSGNVVAESPVDA